MSSALLFDAWLTFGAVAQCALVLRARRFRPHDWLVPMTLLIGCPAAFFAFIRICSTTADAAAAGSCLIGLGIGLTGAGLFVVESAPARMNATALLSLTATFWIAVWPAAPRPDWFDAAVLMSALTVLFAFGPWKAPSFVRFALYAWSMAAAAEITAGGVSARVAHVFLDYHREIPAGLPSIEIALTGAQYFLFLQLLIGMLLALSPGDAEHGWYADRLIASYDADARPRLPGLFLLLVQAAAFAWGRRAGAETQRELVGLASVAALAYGAMSGDDAAVPPPRVDRAGELRLSKAEKAFFARAGGSARGFFVRRRWIIAAAVAAAVIFGIRAARAASDDDDAEESSSEAAPAASTAAPVFAPRPDHVVMGDTNSDPGKVFRAKGGPDKAVVRGGAVIINADGTRLEIAPTKRPAMQPPASPPAAGLTLPALPTMVDAKAPLSQKKRRALSLLGASLAAMAILIYWARRRWRPGG